MTVDVSQESFLPGARLALYAQLQEYRQPLAGARVFVEVTEPDGRLVIVSMTETEAGRFEGLHTTTHKGIYRCRFRAFGASRSGQPFQREDTRTAVVNPRLRPGGDLTNTVGGGGSKTDDDRRRWCGLLKCLLQEPSLARVLAKHDIDPRSIEKCLRYYCGPERKAMTERESTSEGAPTADMERLERLFLALREELRAAGLQSVHLDELFAALPEPKPVAPPPAVAAPEAHHGPGHHSHALPAMVADDDVKFRLIVPPIMRAHARTQPGKPRGGTPGGGHSHGGTSVGGDEHGAGGEYVHGDSHGHGHG
jgi:hypothetical protein